MNTKTKPFTGRIEDKVPSQLANRIHLRPCSNTGSFTLQSKTAPVLPTPEQ